MTKFVKRVFLSSVFTNSTKMCIVHILIEREFLLIYFHAFVCAQYGMAHCCCHRQPALVVINMTQMILFTVTRAFTRYLRIFISQSTPGALPVNEIDSWQDLCPQWSQVILIRSCGVNTFSEKDVVYPRVPNYEMGIRPEFRNTISELD